MTSSWSRSISQGSRLRFRALVVGLRTVGILAAGLGFVSVPHEAEAVSLSGTITYSGSYGPVSISRPIELFVLAHPFDTGGGGPVAAGNVTTNGGAFDVALPNAGTYYLAYWLDVNSDGGANVGEPLGANNGRTWPTSGDPIIVPQAGLAGLKASFGDSLAPGVAGTATYTGSLGQVSESVPIAVVPYLDPDLTVEAPGRLVGRAATNPGRYDVVAVTGTVYLIAFLDLNDSGGYSRGEPFAIYNGRCSTPGDPVDAGPGQTDVNFTFGDENLQACPTPTPISCVGDCGGDGTVTVDEILTMVNIALGNTGVSSCSAGDANHDGQITVDEILTAVNNALNACGERPKIHLNH
jgi:hypothetical protein